MNLIKMIKNEYKYNTVFRQFVNEFCRNNNCTLEDAFYNEQVKKKFYIYTEV